ncbi:MAG TPA: hypothetical protein VFL14_04215, partial [Xanthomonadales bacterium]|nr:hypothetical protein [Xanthomonadales bacterium]
MTAALDVSAGDGTRFGVLVAEPATPANAGLLFVPALGVTARHYAGFARAGRTRRARRGARAPRERLVER